jgi:hypothetical protein
MQVDTFLRQIETMPWFASIGKPLPPNSRVTQIRDWDEWSGPEDEAVSEMHSRQQALYDEIMAVKGTEVARLLWNQIQDIVRRVSAARVPYDDKRDPWYAPTAAVAHAAWTAGLVGLYLYAGWPLPHDLQEQWRWFLDGRWPCDWEGQLPNGRAIVY